MRSVPFNRAATRNPRVAAMARRRVLIRRAVVAAVAIGLVTIGITDVRGHVEVGQLDHVQGIATPYLSNLRLNLTLTNANTADEENNVRYLTVQNLESRLGIDSANSSTQADEIGIFFDKVNLSALDGCLGGVTQALDQIGVGQRAGAFASLGAVGAVCQLAAP